MCSDAPTTLPSYRCVNGHCESTSKNIGRSDGLKHNSLDGSWGSWSRWWFNDVVIINAINSYLAKNKNAEIKERKRSLDGQTNPQMGRLFAHLRSGDQF